MNIAKDKKLHFIGGIILCVFFGIISQDILFGVEATIIISAGKEMIWDWLLGRGTPEFLDFIATVNGAAIVFILVEIFRYATI